jgi:hypothetical protein
MIFARGFARRCAAYLALAALMLQLALSFEHVHKHDVAFSGLGRSDVRAQSQQRFGVELVLIGVALTTRTRSIWEVGKLGIEAKTTVFALARPLHQGRVRNEWVLSEVVYWQA